jgi:hypothetical protein
VNATRHPHRGGSIHAYQRIEARPVLDKGQHVGAPDHNRDIGRQPACKPADDDRSDAIVAPIRVNAGNGRCRPRDYVVSSAASSSAFNIHWRGLLREELRGEYLGVFLFFQRKFSNPLAVLIHNDHSPVREIRSEQPIEIRRILFFSYS